MLLETESLSIGGRSVPGFGLGLPPNAINLQVLSQCAQVSFQAAGPSNGKGPELDPSYFTDVQSIVLGASASVTATFIGPVAQKMPTSFPDTDNGYGSPWTVTSFSITPPAAGTTWNGSQCVAPNPILHAPLLPVKNAGAGAGAGGGVNTAKPVPVKASPPAYYVAGAAGLALVGWLLLK